jgi:tetraacyldisaccharide 4'-kinase
MGSQNILYHIFSFVRILLYPVALLYGAIVWLRNKLYDAKFFSSIEFSVPVITVGNLSTGGTGKTPHVEYLIRLLQYQYRVATMSRGYKRHTQGFLIADNHTNALRIGDEPMQYHMKYPEIVVSVAEERMIGIPALLQRRPDVDVILLDDAYQHRSVKAGLTIVIIVSKCPLDLQEAQAKSIMESIAPLPNQRVFFTGIGYDTPYNFITREPIDIRGKNILLVCAIARPEPLEAFLKNNSDNVHTLSYQDHHYFVTPDLEEIKETYDNWQVANKIILTTEKDAARLQLHLDKLRAWDITIAVLPIAVHVLLNKGHEFDAGVLQYVESAAAENRAIMGFE